MRISDREKILLYSMVILAVLYGGITFLVIPIHEENLVLYEELDDLLFTSDTALLNLTSTKDRELQILQNIDDYREAQSKLIIAQEVEQLEIILVKALKKCNLRFNSLSFTHSDSSEKLKQTEADKEKLEMTENVNASYVSPQLFNLSITGQESNFLYFLDEIYNRGDMVFTNIGYGKSTKTDGTIPNSTFTLTGILYMRTS